jgi:hypothetical protein
LYCIDVYFNKKRFTNYILNTHARAEAKSIVSPGRRNKIHENKYNIAKLKRRV